MRNLSLSLRPVRRRDAGRRAMGAADERNDSGVPRARRGDPDDRVGQRHRAVASRARSTAAERGRSTPIPGASRLDLRAIYASIPNRAWAISSGLADSGQAQIFHADDGVHWIKQFETKQAGVFLDAISFWDDEHGIALSDPVGGRLFVLTTDDGGASWTRVATDNAPPMLPGEAAFAASGTCLTVQGESNVWIGTGGGARARVFRSTDRGRTWSVADTPIHAGGASSGVFSVAFDDAQHGVAVGGDYSKPKEAFENVAITVDGGRTWKLASVHAARLLVRRRLHSGDERPLDGGRRARRHCTFDRWRRELDDDRHGGLQQCRVCIARCGLGRGAARAHREVGRRSARQAVIHGWRKTFTEVVHGCSP